MAGVFQESKGISAFKQAFHKRPVGSEVIKKLAKGDILLVDKPDRLFRSCRDLENTLHWLDSKGASLCIVDFLGATIDQRTWAGKHMLRTMVSFAEFESHLKSCRVRDANAVKRSQGKAVGGLKFGCEVNVDGMVFLPDNIVVMARRAYEMKQNGISYDDIRNLFEEEICKSEGVPYRRSAFHKYHYALNNAVMLARYGHLLAAGVDKGTIACMSLAALKQATVGL